MEIQGRSASHAPGGAVNRLTGLAALLLFWALAIGFRLVSLQVVQHPKYAALARSQQEHEIDIPAPRGTILDRNGQPLAISVPVDSVSVNPQQIADLKLATELLGSTLNLDQQVLYSRLAWARVNHRGFMWVKRRIDPFQVDRLKAFHLDWVTFHVESQRHYPKGDTAAHIIGGVFKDEEGAAGVERGLDKDLKGHNGEERLIMDVKRRGLDSHLDSAPRAGESITLSIDERLQYVAQVALKAGVEAKHARSGTAIVMNPYTGEILALANYPDYDLNVPPTSKEDPIARLDLGASVPFEPGSMFKVITLTAALETTNLRPDSLIPTGNGVLRLPGRTIHESHHGLGTITMAQVLEKSSNIGAILIGMKVGEKNMYNYARRFGFGQRSGLPLPAESPGLLRPLNRWGTTSLASVSMGQEVSVTSVQLARACSVIANGGMLVKPRLLIGHGGKPVPMEAPVRIIRPDTAITMREMMEGVVLRGTGRLHARLDGYTSAGKTGTAQIYDRATHHYSHFYNASFMGFAPVTNPALVVVVTIHHTSGEQGQGADAAAPVFKVIMTEALRMLDVPRDIPEELEAKNTPPTKEKVEDDVSIADLGEPSIMEEEPDAKALIAEQTAPKPEAHDDQIPPAAKGGTGFQPVQSQTKPGASPATLTQAVAAVAPTPPEPTGPVVPDFRGLAMTDVAERAAAQGIQVMLEGSGIARAQLPLPGTPMRQGETIRIVFAR